MICVCFARYKYPGDAGEGKIVLMSCMQPSNRNWEVRDASQYNCPNTITPMRKRIAAESPYIELTPLVLIGICRS